ncbi:MAG TPA: hypothetical protein VL549_08785 [Gemmatimonadales bacterium]|jgi:hypothetical protein|nr:hypothetical protein [Gemmatimonadales bacterium]
MRDIFWGAVIIAIGLVRGDSVFLGNFGILSILFDALGAFFIVRGIVRMQRARQAAAAVPPPPPSPSVRP